MKILNKKNSLRKSDSIEFNLKKIILTNSIKRVCFYFIYRKLMKLRALFFNLMVERRINLLHQVMV